MNTVGRTFSMSLFYAELYQLAWDMCWLMLLAITFIIVDLWYGVGKSRMRGIEVRMSRAIRRTFLKIGDYLCILVAGCFLGKAIGEPLGVSYITVAVICMLLAILAEGDSIIINYCEVKGLKKKFSIWALFKDLLGLKSKGLEDAIDKSMGTKYESVD